jgi:hypothetical protein
MLREVKTSESDTPSVFYCESTHVFDNSVVFTSLNMTKIHSILQIDLIARIAGIPPRK